MEEETQENHSPKVSVTVPERYFPRWLREDSKINRLKLRYDLIKESLPYVTALVTLVLALVFCREALIFVILTVLTLLYRRKKRG
jgi:hypothetical protein